MIRAKVIHFKKTSNDDPNDRTGIGSWCLHHSISVYAWIYKNNAKLGFCIQILVGRKNEENSTKHTVGKYATTQ